MDRSRKKQSYVWAVSAGANAAIAAKYFQSLLIKYGMIVPFNVIMWGCYVNSLQALSSLQATVTNFISSGIAGFLLFHESLSHQWFAGALLIVIDVAILRKSSIEEKASVD